MQTIDILDVVGNNHKIIVFLNTTVSMEVNPHMEVPFLEGKVHVDKFSLLEVIYINGFFLGKVIIFAVWNILYITIGLIY